MVIDIGFCVDESMVRWRYSDTDWIYASIEDLIEAYEKLNKDTVNPCDNCKELDCDWRNYGD